MQVQEALKAIYKVQKPICRYAVRHRLHYWVDCGKVAMETQDGEYYCGEHAAVMSWAER